VFHHKSSVWAIIGASRCHSKRTVPPAATNSAYALMGYDPTTLVIRTPRGAIRYLYAGGGWFVGLQAMEPDKGRISTIEHVFEGGTKRGGPCHHIATFPHVLRYVFLPPLWIRSSSPPIVQIAPSPLAELSFGTQAICSFRTQTRNASTFFPMGT
jgi:hypothetical protein